MTPTQEAAMRQALEALEFMEAYLATEQQAKSKAITALRAALAEQDNGGKTGWPRGLLQDDSRGLSKWMASRPDAKRRVREALADGDNLAPTEPVAWGNMREDGAMVLLSISQHPEDRANWMNPVPLYTAPPQRKPLTEEEVKAMWESHRAALPCYLCFARAIERAHGIGSKA